MKRQRKVSASRPHPLLGGLSAEAFLRQYWQKQPLLIRGAVPGIAGRLDPTGLKRLAAREDAESRLVRHQRGRWRLEHGPFEPEALRALPGRGWSLLVSGVNHWLPYADRLLGGFDFLPHARLDDVMVSLAPPGGGVGPHFDSYDVFLIQGRGSRRWEVSEQDDLELVPDAPLRILKRFTPTQSWVLEPGDMLYLPPRLAHNGVALSECMTWSIGFRAPTHQEIATAFLSYLQDRLSLDGRYADPDLSVAVHPGELPEAMVQRLGSVIDAIDWDRNDIRDFLGTYLSEPKPNVFFDPPRKPMSAETFAQAVNSAGVRLDPRTRLLFSGGHFYINGEHVQIAGPAKRALVTLADRRSLPAGRLPAGLQPLLYDWYVAGFLVPGEGDTTDP
jgi:50S ribosomal protein L16 3-hydroxylase